MFQKHKQLIQSLFLLILFMGSFIFFYAAPIVHANVAPDVGGNSNGNNTSSPSQTCTPINGSVLCSDCKGGSGVQGCGTCTNQCADPALKCTNTSCDIVNNYVNPFITLLSVTVGVVVVISLILGGIQYSTSAGDPQKAAAAKNRITKTLVAVVAYTFLLAFLQFILPGGLLHRAS